jgi:hypothetical protein
MSVVDVSERLAGTPVGRRWLSCARCRRSCQQPLGDPGEYFQVGGSVSRRCRSRLGCNGGDRGRDGLDGVDCCAARPDDEDDLPWLGKPTGSDR